MEKPEKLTVLSAQWSPEAAELLRPCFTVAGALEQVGAQVESGRAVLFVALAESGEMRAAFVLRVDGDEGVIVAAVGPLKSMPALLPHIEGRFMGCDSVRFHTSRPGVARLMAECGYTDDLPEIVLRKRLKK